MDATRSSDEEDPKEFDNLSKTYHRGTETRSF